MENISTKTLDYKCNIEKLTDSFLTSLNDEFSNLQEMMEYYHRNKNLEQELDTLQKKSILEQNEINILQNKIIELEKKNINIPSLQQENNELKGNIQKLEKLIEEKDIQMNQLIQEHKEFNKVSHIKAAHTKLEEKTREIEVLKQKLKNSKKMEVDKYSIKQNENKELVLENKMDDEVDNQSLENKMDDEVDNPQLENNTKTEDTEEDEEEEITYVKKKIKKVLRYISEDENRYVYTILENDEVGEIIGQVVNKKFVPLD